jgi:hypothetical protein
MNTPAMHPLGAQQQALLQALLARPGNAQAHTAAAQPPDFLNTRHSQATRGWAAYQANGHAMAERALRSAYPVVNALMGADNFALLARDLWHQHPPTRGDLAQWGDALPGFLQGNAALTDAPYLGDVARTEWALHTAAGAANIAPDPASFARLAEEDAHGLSLTLAPGTWVLSSRYPVVSLVQAHAHTPPRLDGAAQRLRQGVGEHALVWRSGLQPCLQAIDPPVAALLQALLAGADVPQALDAAQTSTPEVWDLAAWLPAAVGEALVLGVHRLAPSPA